MIINVQKNDVELQQTIQLVRYGDKIDYFVEDDGGVYYKNGLWVLADKELKKTLLYESHNIVFTMHLVGNKMYQDLKQYY